MKEKLPPVGLTPLSSLLKSMPEILLTSLSNKHGVKDVHVSIVDLSEQFYFDGVADVPCIEFCSNNISEYYNRLYALLNHFRWYDRIKLIYFPEFTKSLAKQVRNISLNSLLLFKNEIVELKDQHELRDLIRFKLCKFVDRRILNIYKYMGAVTGKRFFGRNAQLEAIISNPKRSYLVSGTRMSGKTSLLLQAKNRIEFQYNRKRGLIESKRLLENPEHFSFSIDPYPSVVYIDCKKFDNFRSFIVELLIQLGERSKRIDPEKWHPQRYPEFYRYMRKYVRRLGNLRFRVFLDEYDQIFKIEKAESSSITWNFRSMYMENSSSVGILQFAIAGSKNLAKLCQNNNSAFYNFLNFDDARLDNFNIGTVREILEFPMNDLGFRLKDPQTIANVLLQETAGRPSSVQYLCKRAVEFLLQKNKSYLTEEIIQWIASTGKYLRFYKSSLFENTDALQQLILCSQVNNKKPGATFNFEDIAEICEKNEIYIDPSTINNSLDDLVNSGFLNEDQDTTNELRYELSVPAIYKIFANENLSKYSMAIRKNKL